MINLIVAIGLNGELGKDNQLLWNLPNDMKHFKELTTKNFICMGRKTYESIGKPLPNRTNIIISRNTKYNSPVGIFVYNSLEDVINEYEFYNQREDELFIIGGADVYKQSMQYCDRMYITVVEEIFEDADAHFPKFDLTEWKITEHTTHEANDKNPYKHHFITYERINK